MIHDAVAPQQFSGDPGVVLVTAAQVSPLHAPAARPVHAVPVPLRPVSVVVVSAQPLVRRGLRHLLSRDRGFRVLAECGSVRDGRSLSARLRPDVVVLDVVPATGPVLPGDVADLARRQGRKVVVLADVRSRIDSSALVATGASAVLDRDGDPVRIVRALRRITGMQVLDSPADVERSPSRLPAVPPLTPREVEVLERIVRGAPNEVIADELGIAGSTVKFHIRGLLRKFGARNRTEIAVAAMRHDLV